MLIGPIFGVMNIAWCFPIAFTSSQKANQGERAAWKRGRRNKMWYSVDTQIKTVRITIKKWIGGEKKIGKGLKDWENGKENRRKKLRAAAKAVAATKKKKKKPKKNEKHDATCKCIPGLAVTCNHVTSSRSYLTQRSGKMSRGRALLICFIINRDF